MLQPTEVEGRTDPFGRVHPRKDLMCEHFGVRYDTFSQRLKRGWTLRQALNIDAPPKRSVVKCPLGVNFNSKEAMCEHYGVTITSYRKRLKLGWTDRQALGIDLKPDSVTCPKGTQFNTLKDMAQHYNVPYNVFISRRNKGWTTEQILGLSDPPSSVRCPNDMLFDSILVMCKHYGVTYTQYYESLKKGLSTKQALGIDFNPYYKNNGVACPNGKKFDSVHAMCKYYGVEMATYNSRLGTNWTERQSLGLDAPPDSKYIVTCPNGIEFENANAMCKHYGVNRSTYNARIYTSNWTLTQALGIAPPPSGDTTVRDTLLNTLSSLNNKLQVSAKKRKLNGVQFYLVQDIDTKKNYVLNELQIKTYPQCLRLFNKVK